MGSHSRGNKEALVDFSSKHRVCTELTSLEGALAGLKYCSGYYSINWDKYKLLSHLCLLRLQ